MDRQRRVTSFTLKDLVDGHIDYVQRDHKNKEPTLDAFLLHVSDGVSQSPTHKFNITINVRLLLSMLRVCNRYNILWCYLEIGFLPSEIAKMGRKIHRLVDYVNEHENR